jgi:RNA polymerase primary sigma factor
MELSFFQEAIERLPERHRYVLVRRYGLDDRGPSTLAVLSNELEVSRERVRQIQREAEHLLRSKGAREADGTLCQQLEPI